MLFSNGKSAICIRRSAFTLVEILVVVLILGIASAIIIPQIGSRDDLSVAAGARVLMSDLIYAQNRAIATQTPHFVKFEGQKYSIFSALPTTGVQPMTHPISKNPYAVTFGAANTGLKNVSLDSTSFGGATVMGFDELGSPMTYDGVSTPSYMLAAGTMTVKCGAATLTISIEPYTGETTVN